MPEILEKDEIPYRDQAQRLFNLYGAGATNSAEQQIVPFLGAGVSISGRTPSADLKPVPNYPDRQKLESIFGQLGLDGQAKTFLEIAILLACRLQFSQIQSSFTGDDIEMRIKNDDYPPSAGELAQLFSQLSSYTRFKQVAKTIRERLHGAPSASNEELIEMLKLLADESGIASPPDSLTSITGYYESVSDRAALWNNLSFIGTKSKPSKTHRLLAAAAKHCLNQADALEDYLIITTNYDCLMEMALDDLDVPYAVLVTRRSDQKVLVRFSNKMPNAAKLNERNSKKEYPNNFYLKKPLMKLAVVYKIHGCLNPGMQSTDDGVIISDSDYINYISQMGTSQGVTPACVASLMEKKGFLFLGYSLGDWNVRSIYETLKKKRIRDKSNRDFAVMRKVDEYEKVFFDKNDIQIIKANLNDYADGILRHLPDELRSKV